MRATNISLLALIALMAAPAPARAQTPVPDPVAESARRAFADYGARLNRGDYTGALEYYADDPRFFWIEHDKVVAWSKADIVKGYEHLKGSGMSMNYGAPTVTVISRDAAVITAAFSARMGSGAQAAQFSGMLTLVMIRTTAGWRFLSGRA